MTNEIQKLKDAAKRAGMSNHFVDGKLRADMFIIGSDFIDRLYEEITKSCLNLTSLAASGGNAAPPDLPKPETMIVESDLGHRTYTAAQMTTYGQACAAASAPNAALVAALQQCLIAFGNIEVPEGGLSGYDSVLHAESVVNAALSAAGVKGD